MRISGRTLIPLGIVVMAVYLLVRVHEILLPFVLAASQAYLLNPLIRFFEVRGLRRPPIVIVLYMMMVMSLSLGVYYGSVVVSREAQEAAQKMPFYVQKGQYVLNELKLAATHPSSPSATETKWAKLGLLRPIIINARILDFLSERGRTWPQHILERMPSFASGLLPVFEIGFLVPFIAFFLMREGNALRDTALGWIPSRYIEMALNILVEIDNSLGKYVRGLCLEAFCVGVMAYVGFSIIHLDYALQIALVVGLANVVPYVGPLLGGTIGTGVALFQWGDPTKVLWVWGVCIAVRFIEDWTIQPLVMRHTVHLHPVAIVFSLMAGAKLFGFWGLLFGVPMACMAKVLLQVIWSWYVSQYGLRSSEPLPEVNRIPLI